MRTQPTDTPWRKKLTLAAVSGIASGIARAIATWTLTHFNGHF